MAIAWAEKIIISEDRRISQGKKPQPNDAGLRSFPSPHRVCVHLTPKCVEVKSYWLNVRVNLPQILRTILCLVPYLLDMRTPA